MITQDSPSPTLQPTEPPIDKLPPELLVDIFLASRPAKRLKYAIPWEIIISHVSARWRILALNTPSMWTKVEIYSSRSLGRVHDYLKRSDPCPVDLWFDIANMDRRVGSVAPVVDIAIEHIARWRSLRVFAFNKNTTNTILSKIAYLKAPLLQRIRMVDDGINNSHTDTPWDGSVLAGGAPNLVSVQMDNAKYLPLLVNVTTLHLRSTNVPPFSLSTRVVSALAQSCPSLVTLSIRGTFSNDESEWNIASPPTVTMSSLRFLWFCENNVDSMAEYFLTSISLPQLESLWLDLPQQILRVLTMLIYRTTFPPVFPALRYLTIESFDFFTSSHAAHIFPTVTSIHFPRFKASHVTFLKNTLLIDRYWVHLGTLVFRWARVTDPIAFSNVLEEIIRLRLDTCSPIKRVLLDKDVFSTLTNRDVLMELTTLELLSAENYNDPWWILVQKEKEDPFQP